MRRTSVWRTGLLMAVAMLTPRLASAQGLNYAPPDFNLPLPLYSTQPEQGGLYLYGDFVFFQQTNPLRQQLIAYRGFVDSDGSVTGKVGTFVGSGADALDVNQLKGPGTYEPGFRVGGGWKFDDGSSFSIDYLYITDASFRAAATSAPPNQNGGPNLADTFLTSFVYNFPNNFAGPANKLGNSTVIVGSNGVPIGTTNNPSPILPPGATTQTTQIGDNYALYGIWNGASIMTESFVQRAQGIDATYRETIYETETYRLSGIVGPRWFWIWEEFRWVTTSLDNTGNAGPTDVAVYNNITSNEMYGAFIGCDNEWYLGHGFACFITLDVAGLLDDVKELADYQLAYRALVENKRAVHNWTGVGELEGKVGIAWYLAEGIQLRFDFDGMIFFNTLASEHPVDLNYGGIAPGWEHVTRVFDGWTGGIALTF